MYIIYTLRCPFNNEIRYVGQTKMSLQKRLGGHIYESRKLKKRYSHKDRWISKILSLGFRPEISEIESISLSYNIEHILERETYWILNFKDNGCNLVNATNGGQYSSNNKIVINSFVGEENPMWGKLHSEKSKELMSLRKVGLYKGVNNPRSKPIYQYNSNLVLLRRWDYAKECSDEYKISRGNISTSAKYNSLLEDNEYRKCSGYIFTFKEI